MSLCCPHVIKLHFMFNGFRKVLEFRMQTNTRSDMYMYCALEPFTLDIVIQATKCSRENCACTFSRPGLHQNITSLLFYCSLYTCMLSKGFVTTQPFQHPLPASFTMQDQNSLQHTWRLTPITLFVAALLAPSWAPLEALWIAAPPSADKKEGSKYNVDITFWANGGQIRNCIYSVQCVLYRSNSFWAYLFLTCTIPVKISTRDKLSLR